MPVLVRQLLTKCDVHERPAHDGTRYAPISTAYSGDSTQDCTHEAQAELLMTAPRYTVAIVDDDPSLLKALGRLLTENGYGVELFASFADVLKDIPTSTARCILIDCQLGQFSGIELARQLTASGFVFPIIFMTASDDDGVRQQAIAVGCAAFLRKPFLQNQLLEAVSRAKEKHSV